MYKLIKPVAVAVLTAFTSQALAAALFFQQQPVTVAVTEFIGTGTNPDAAYLGTRLPEAITSDLAASGRIAVLSGDQVSQAPGTPVAQNTHAAAQLGQSIGAQSILTGSFSAIGSMVKIDIRLVDVESGSVLLEKSHYLLEGAALDDLASTIARDVETTLVGAAPEPPPQPTTAAPTPQTGPVQPLPPEPATSVAAASSGFPWYGWILIGAGVVGGVYAVQAIVNSSGQNSTISIDFPLP